MHIQEKNKMGGKGKKEKKIKFPWPNQTVPILPKKDALCKIEIVFLSSFFHFYVKAPHQHVRSASKSHL